MCLFHKARLYFHQSFEDFLSGLLPLPHPSPSLFLSLIPPSLTENQASQKEEGGWRYTCSGRPSCTSQCEVGEHPKLRERESFGTIFPGTMVYSSHIAAQQLDVKERARERERDLGKITADWIAIPL
jgi:hypothetical protein